MTPQCANMKLSLIISYYKALPNLRLILKALNRQSCMDFEVILSEDDANEETKDFLKAHSADYDFIIRHIFQQQDEGFRKNQMLNRAIGASSFDACAFIDGDCIPHRHFVKEYLRNMEENRILIGRRVMLGKKFSTKLMQQESLRRLRFFCVLFSDSGKKKEAIYNPYFPVSLKIRPLLGANWGILKKHLLEVNGYDEDYQYPGVGEDNDIGWRLEQNGLIRKQMKNKAIVYHIYHPRSYGQKGVMANFALWAAKKESGHIRCLNGIQKITVA